jgi:predicted acyltransferase (DUF342 family)
MNKYFALLFLVLSTTLTLGQNKEKIKGSKIVTVESKSINDFQALIVEDNLEISLERGEKAEVKIEADENLHDIISVEVSDNTLRIHTTKQASNFKKLTVKVTYTEKLNLITAKNETTVNAIQELLLNSITLKAEDASKLFINVNVTNFTLHADGKSKTELNLNSKTATIDLIKNSSLKALINTTDLRIDQYQKSTATVEGTAENVIVRLDNNSSFTGNKFTTKKAEITTESYTNCSLFVENNVIITATDQSQIQLVGSPKIEILKFLNEAKLIKKLK